MVCRADRSEVVGWLGWLGWCSWWWVVLWQCLVALSWRDLETKECRSIDLSLRCWADQCGAAQVVLGPITSGGANTASNIARGVAKEADRCRHGEATPVVLHQAVVPSVSTSIARIDRGRGVATRRRRRECHLFVS